MSDWREQFEAFALADDIQQRRALRSIKTTTTKSEDPYEEYLLRISRSGSYGGEVELVAFTRAFDQDVTVHLPRKNEFGQESMEYTNGERKGPATNKPLHICYGGDEETRAHYDSARNEDGSIPRQQQSPSRGLQDAALLATISAASITPTLLSPDNLTKRAIRGSRADMSNEIRDLLQESQRDKRSSLDRLGDKNRARSPSVTSSQRSTSSKRSLEDDDGEPARASKRADRRKSMRRRANMTVTYANTEDDMSSPASADSPSSTQETELSSEPNTSDDSQKASIQTITIDDDDESDEDPIPFPRRRGRVQPPKTPNTISSKTTAPVSAKAAPRLISVAERPKPTLRA
jgi:hypothetical protein